VTVSHRCSVITYNDCGIIFYPARENALRRRYDDVREQARIILPVV
jgi:hypothetical protein